MTHHCSGLPPQSNLMNYQNVWSPFPEASPSSVWHQGFSLPLAPNPQHGIYGESLILWSPLSPLCDNTDVSFQNSFSLASTVTLVTSPAFINKALLRHADLCSLVLSNFFLASRTQAAVGMLIVQPDSKISPAWPLFCSAFTLGSHRPGRGPQKYTRQEDLS